MSADDLVDTLQELAEVLQTQRTLGAALAAIAEAATVSVPGCDAASIAISIAGRPATAAVTAKVALELDMVQYDTADGPCLTCFQSMSTIRVDWSSGATPSRTSRRWPGERVAAASSPCPPHGGTRRWRR